ncbi:MAG: hypothetical protein RLZZ71_1066 [Bacteroidota bacterium]
MARRWLDDEIEDGRKLDSRLKNSFYKKKKNN